LKPTISTKTERLSLISTARREPTASRVQGTSNLNEQALNAGDASKHFSVKQIIDLVG
jgi:hypothetical protein